MLFGQVSVNRRLAASPIRVSAGESWARFQAANLPAMLSTLLGWRLGGVRADSELQAPGLRHAKDLLLGGAAFNTAFSAALGVTAASRAPGDYTPVRSGTTLASETSPSAALAQRLLLFFRDGLLALLAVTIVVSALIETVEPKPRGLLSRLIGLRQLQE